MQRILLPALLLIVLGSLVPNSIFAKAPTAAPHQLNEYSVSLPLVIGGQGQARSSHDSTILEAQVLTAINSIRQANGCPALTLAPELSAAARQHSYDMAYNDFYAHNGSDGSDMASRTEQAGYNWLSVAENIAVGQDTVDGVVQLWMNSPGHRAIILDCSMHETGIGFVYLENDPGTVTWHSYWTELFGTR